MADEHDKAEGAPETYGDAEEDAEGDRPTVSPPFDPAVFAREALRPPPAPFGTAEPPDAHTRATPAQGTAQQAAAAEASRPPRAAPHGGAWRKTPASTLSLANARVPSLLPPRLGWPVADEALQEERAAEADEEAPPTRRFDDDAGSALSPVDRGWAELELATRPPPEDPDAETPELDFAAARTPRLDFELEEPPAPDARPGADGGPGREPPGPVEPRADGGPGREPPGPVKPRAEEMNDRLSLGDYSGALELAEQILADAPGDAEAAACAKTCRGVLRQMYVARLGPLERVAVVMVPRDQLRWLSIDHKAGFVLSLVDGVSSLEMIIDVSGMPELDTLRILSDLAQQRIIALRS